LERRSGFLKFTYFINAEPGFEYSQGYSKLHMLFVLGFFFLLCVREWWQHFKTVSLIGHIESNFHFAKKTTYYMIFLNYRNKFL
jgi:hypothetical protein